MHFAVHAAIDIYSLSLHCVYCVYIDFLRMYNWSDDALVDRRHSFTYSNRIFELKYTKQNKKWLSDDGNKIGMSWTKATAIGKQLTEYICVLTSWHKSFKSIQRIF